MTNANQTLKILKADTAKLIELSLSANQNIEDEGDLIDKSIIGHIELLNMNPNFAITGSCSGHSGYPFISFIFKNKQIATSYLNEFKKLGLIPIKSDDFRMSYFKMNFPHLSIKEEWSIGFKKKVSKKAAQKFWDDLAAYKTWLKSGNYQPLKAKKSTAVRSKKDQIPKTKEDIELY